MNKIVATSILVLITFGSYAIPIISITKIDGGRRGYWFVSYEMGENSGGTSGWIVNCFDPGREPCKTHSSIPPEGISQAEFNKAIELVEYAENMWDEGLMNGIYSETIVDSSLHLSTLQVHWYVIDRIIHIDVDLLN